MLNILVQLFQPNWTMKALHEACSLARRENSPQVTLLHLNLISPRTLGTIAVPVPVSNQTYADLSEYWATAEDYGIILEVQAMRYFRLRDAIIQAAEFLDAHVIYATLPNSLWAFWRSWQLHNLKRQLTIRNRTLHTLEATSTSTR